MAGRYFRSMLGAQWREEKFLCVGLDPDLEKMPESLRMLGVRQALVAFNREIVDATKDIVCAYKPNSAFYEAYGDLGFAALRETIIYINEQAPTVPVILDAKRGDNAHSNEAYLRAIVDYLRADAVTVHPYLGAEALRPFLERQDLGVIVLCRTSNEGAGELQDVRVGNEPLYQVIARAVADTWNANGNCALVVGATYPEEMKRIRNIAPELPFLIPGVGAQGGDVKRTVDAGRDQNGAGIIISASRSIIYASTDDDFATAVRTNAQELHLAIKNAL